MMATTDWNLVEHLSWIVTILGFPGLIFSLYLASGLLKELIRIAQSQNAIALNAMVFNDPTNIGILGAIETEEPILEENKGKFNWFQLEKYLGDFETVAMVYDERLLTRAQFDQHFSHYVEQLSRNPEVTEYLESYPEYFDGLRTLFKLQQRIDG